MRKIIVSYSPTDPDAVGSEQELPDDEAAGMVREGRARWADTVADEANNPNAPAKRETRRSSTPPPSDSGTPPAVKTAAGPPGE